jgi:anti-sigma regulatory factor (Ser/Thr protein kinase)
VSADAPALAPSRAGAMWAGSYTLPNNTRSPGLARLLVRQALVDCPPGVSDSAEVLVSELVTNAIRHAETDLVLHIALSPTMRIAVDDTSSDPVRLGLGTDGGDQGRGLAIVEALSTTWNWGATPTGKQVWFEI